MSGRYFVELVDVLEAAGVTCKVQDVNRGWESRARSSGGFGSGLPLGCIWHHTASSTTPLNDLNYMIHNSDDAPIGNLLLDRDGVVWPIAAGGANTQGKGGPLTFSRGTVPLDSGNSQLFGLEVANSGTGEAWPQKQIDAYFKTSNALNKLFGNLVTDLATHTEWAPDRKIDPAKASAVQGPWRPSGFSSADTWSGDDIRAEAQLRAAPEPEPIPIPTPSGEIDMLAIDFGEPGKDTWWCRMTYTGSQLCHVRSPFDAVQERGGITTVSVNETELNAMLDTISTVGDSPFHGAGQSPNDGLDRKWNAARGRT